MDRSDVQETLVSLYLRLNGYFVSGFIVHAQNGATTEMDVLAVRLPRHQEPEREVQCCKHLAIPSNHIDFIVGEVKGGQGAVNFNARFRESPGAIKTVLHRFGAFDDPEISRVMVTVPALLGPSYLILARHGSGAFHVLFATDVEGDNVRVVTSYRPDPGEWQTDLKVRRPKR